jgi:lon-related putative ATP-dependent protease
MAGEDTRARREPLAAARLRPACRPETLDFDSTAELAPLRDFFGQHRAREALDFGTAIRRPGYNLFALGPAGTGKLTLIRDYLGARARTQNAPPDWCYVNNFDDWRKPLALALPGGRGSVFARDVAALVEEIAAALQGVFESDEYRNRAEAIEQQLTDRQEQATERLQQQAAEKGLTLVRTPGGITLAPTRDGSTLGLKEFRELPEDERDRIQASIEALQETLREAFREAPQWQKETREAMAALNREMARNAISQPIDRLRERYGGLEHVIAHLDALEADVIAHFQHFLAPQGESPPLPPAQVPGQGDGTPFLARYAVNVLVHHPPDGGAPVIHADHPTYNNLVGRVEHRAVQGTLVTDFTMIRAGALHRANGGYLLLDAVKVLGQPYAWDALKRAVKGEEIRIESLAETLSLMSTAALEPEPIALDVKIVLIGEAWLYYLLARLDHEFADLFKVQVEFDDRMARTGDAEQRYARMIATIARDDGLPPLDRGAVARVIDYSVRLVDDNEKLGTGMRAITDLLAESAFEAEQREAPLVEAGDVQRAIDAKTRRADRIRHRLHEEIGRGTLLIATDGEQTGQVNALSVLTLGGFSFGRPSRVTARVRMGRGQVVDIEREVEMGGPVHSKGVLILTHFLAGRYALDVPLSLSASLVFEQSYGGIEGDSASCAELCALLSALAELPVRQDLAITGSVNQRGDVQAVGGVNDKIEGFFDVCRARGLTGRQGVLIPEANVAHLMLREDVVAAAEDGRFAIYPVAHVDEAIALLTGVPAGGPGEGAEFADGTVNHRVEARLRHFSRRIRDFTREGRDAAPPP